MKKAERSCGLWEGGERKHYPDGTPHPHPRVLGPLQRPAGIPHDTMDRERRQPHARKALKDGPLRHHAPVILDRRHVPRLERGDARAGTPFPRIRRPDGSDARFARVQDALVAEVGFVAFVADVADEVGPGDAVGGADEPWVGDGAEGFADVGGVGNVAVGTQEDSAGTGEVGCVAEGGVCGVFGSVQLDSFIRHTRVCEGFWDDSLRAIIDLVEERFFVVYDLLEVLG